MKAKHFVEELLRVLIVLGVILLLIGATLKPLVAVSEPRDLYLIEEQDYRHLVVRYCEMTVVDFLKEQKPDPTTVNVAVLLQVCIESVANAYPAVAPTTL